MRIFSIVGNSLSETDTLDNLRVPEQGYLWIACARAEFEKMQAQIQSTLQALCGMQLVDLHISDLLNQQLPSHFDYTSQYDVLVFRRLGAAGSEKDASKGGPAILPRIDTSPVGFGVFDRVLLTVHSSDCVVRDAYAAKMRLASLAESRAAGVRLASGPADLMLRIVHHMVDGFLELRRVLTHQLDHWQSELLNPKTRFNNWNALLEARLSLHHLDDVCEDQRTAILDWIESIKSWPEAQTPTDQRERDLMQVRSRDVLEHIERVVHHVRRLEQSAETAVQMHFNAQSHRTNEIMRTLTVLTAVFLPLNLIAGIFGMNFEFIPMLHLANGFWVATGLMGLIASMLVVFFWRKRYLERSVR